MGRSSQCYRSHTDHTIRRNQRNVLIITALLYHDMVELLRDVRWCTEWAVGQRHCREGSEGARKSVGGRFRNVFEASQINESPGQPEALN